MYVLSQIHLFSPSILTRLCCDQLKGGDSLLYHAIKVYKLTPELHWAAGGYIWPLDRLVDCGVDMPFFNRQSPPSVGAPLRGVFSPSGSVHGHDIEESDKLRSRVEGSAAILLSEAGIVILTDHDSLGPTGKERAPFVSGGMLEKLVVNVLLVAYVP